MITINNSQQVFEEAINHGFLSDTNEHQEVFAGSYMYMHSTNESHYFKHIQTREYITTPNMGG